MHVRADAAIDPIFAGKTAAFVQYMWVRAVVLLCKQHGPCVGFVFCIIEQNIIIILCSFHEISK